MTRARSLQHKSEVRGKHIVQPSNVSLLDGHVIADLALLGPASTFRRTVRCNGVIDRLIGEGVALWSS
jgi:hypothetical protein